MGIDLAVFRKLLEIAPQVAGNPRPASLMLGRQGVHIRPRQIERANRLLNDCGLGATTLKELSQDDGYSETMLENLGFGAAESLDFSEFEGATHVADLGAPLPEEFHDRYDFIFDGGTMEHIFNVPVALANVFRMLRENGVFFSVTNLNGFWWHGLYQFTPELVYSFWERSAGCQILDCAAVPQDTRKAEVHLPDPGKLGRRLGHLENKVPKGRVYICYAVRKLPMAKLAGDVYQSDYVTAWREH